MQATLLVSQFNLPALHAAQGPPSGPVYPAWTLYIVVVPSKEINVGRGLLEDVESEAADLLQAFGVYIFETMSSESVLLTQKWRKSNK
jgi:hypothetical protein